MVKDQKDCKAAVNKVIPHPGDRNLACLREAVTHFTGTLMCYNEEPGGKIRVQFDGYYMMGSDFF